MHRSSRLALLGAFSLGVFLVGAELMVTAVALPRIVPDLADWTELRRASWIVNGYLLAYVAAMPLAGRLADRAAVPPLFAGALALFGLGSLLAGAAGSLEWLIGARLLQGAGGGAVVPLATAGASHLFEGPARGRALGVVGAMTFLGMAAGPFAGAAVLELFELGPVIAAAGMGGTLAGELLAPSWRWVFYLGAPLALVAALFGWAAAPGWRAERGTTRLDLLGATLFTLAVAAGLLALTWLGTEGPDPALLGGLAVIAALAAALRLRTAEAPFLDPALLRRPGFAAAVLLSLLTGYALATAIIGGAVFVDRVLYGGAGEQRLALGALAAASALGALLAGLALRRLGLLVLSLGGLVVSVVGLMLLAAAGPLTSATTLAGALALFGLGFGLTVTPRSVAAVETLGRGAFGLASAGVTVARMVGMAVGLAALTAFGSERIEALSVVLRDQAARDAILPEALRGRPLQDGLVVDVLERWAADQAAGILATIFALAAIVTLLAALPALALRGSRLAPGGSLVQTAADGTDGDADDTARGTGAGGG